MSFPLTASTASAASSVTGAVESLQVCDATVGHPFRRYTQSFSEAPQSGMAGDTRGVDRSRTA